jgi:hypothetical protein
MEQMDYFDQKPDLDMKAFYVGRAIKLAGDVKAGAAPPPAAAFGWRRTMTTRKRKSRTPTHAF